MKLEVLSLRDTQIADAGCAALAAELDSGALPALKGLYLNGIPASAAAKAALERRACARRTSRVRSLSPRAAWAALAALVSY